MDTERELLRRDFRVLQWMLTLNLVLLIGILLQLGC
jgi:hypothetical protein